jgi:hypothetical protein
MAKLKNISVKEQGFRWLIILVSLVLLVIKLFFPNLFLWLLNLRFDTVSIILIVIIGLAFVQPYLSTLAHYIDRIHKRSVIIAICLILVPLKLISPKLEIDIYIVWLIGIAAFLFVLPDLKSLTPFIKRIRIGDTELELKESIGSLEKEVEKAQDAAERESEDVDSARTSVSSDIEKVLEESGRDPRAAFLLLSSKIEEQLRLRLEEAGKTPLRTYPAIRYVEMGINLGIFPQDFLPAFRDFWSVRNRVAHGAAFNVEDSYILSLISLGTQLLRIASTSKKSGDLGNVEESPT